MNDLTVIIPTFFRNALLAKCLNGMVLQTVPPGEVILVDDGNGYAKEVFEQFKEKIPLQYIPVKFKGPVAARNLALKMTTSGYAAFLDDDCIPSPDFCKTCVETFQKYPEIEAQMGRILWAAPERNPEAGKYFIARYRQHIYDSRHIIFTDNTFMEKMVQRYNYKVRERLPGISTHFSGSNSAIRMEFLLKTGGFDEAFRTMSDKEMAYRIISNNGLICYNPGMIVCHAHDYSLVRSLKRAIRSVPYEKRLQALYPDFHFPAPGNDKKSAKNQLVPILVKLSFPERLYQMVFRIIHKTAYTLPLKKSVNPLASTRHERRINR